MGNMEENYIHIFSYFIGQLMEQKRIELKQAYFLMAEFEQVCDGIKTRADLISFLDQHAAKYWELKELKKQLLDSNYSFS